MEGTAGNTGIGLAHLCNSLGYKCVIFMPNTQSQVSPAALSQASTQLSVTWKQPKARCESEKEARFSVEDFLL